MSALGRKCSWNSVAAIKAALARVRTGIRVNYGSPLSHRNKYPHTNESRTTQHARAHTEISSVAVMQVSEVVAPTTI